MARKWTIPFLPFGMFLPNSAYAQFTQLPTTLVSAIAFDASIDESVILVGTVPENYSGGTLKVRIMGAANTTTAADGVRLNAVTEFRTPGAGESINIDNFDASADSVTVNFHTTAYALIQGTIALTPDTAPAAGDLMRIKLTRDTAHADDTLAVDFLLVWAEVYEEV